MSTNSSEFKIKITVKTDQLTVAPGEKLDIPLLLTNEGSAPDQVRINVEGIPLAWVSTEQQVVLLPPGEQRQIFLNIHLPALPNARLGRYDLKLRIASVIDPERVAETRVTLTVAGFELKGRLGVLLEGLQYTVVPGERLAIPLWLINNGLAADGLRLALEGLPPDWVTSPAPTVWLEAGEMKEVVLVVQPPRQPDTRAGRNSFRIIVNSHIAPDQSPRIDCSLLVAAFTEFKTHLEAAKPDQNLPAQVLIHNLSNVQEAFQVTWSSPEDSLTFNPGEPGQISLASGETTKLEFTARPTRRPLFGGEKGYAYTVQVQASNEQSHSLEGLWNSRGLLPVWVLIASISVLLVLCLYLIGSRLLPGTSQDQPAIQTATETPILTSTPTALVPTATQSQIDQKPLLIERNWHLVSINDTRSQPGVQEPFTRFNPDGTLIGYTGCKDLRANYQTDFNGINVANIILGPGACPDTSLQMQEDAFMAILRTARSYFVAASAMQIAGDAGFLNHSLYPVNRPEEILPPQAVIRAVPQALVGQVVVFDGSASTGQVPLVSWKWEFGDGISASGEIVQHTYTTPGTFTVRLTVTDQRGQTGSITGQIHVLPLPTPTAIPTSLPPSATPPQPTPPPQQPTFTPEPTPLPPTATPEPTPLPKPPQANIVGPSQGFIGEPVNFDASASQAGSSPLVSFSWSLGNGEDLPASPQSNASAIYNRAGNYEVTVFVQDANGLTSQATTHISIDARLETSVWTLSRINSAPLLPGTAITMQFKDGVLAGFAGCNTYQAEYTAVLNDDGSYTITIGQLTTSRLACPQDIMEQEQAYLQSLQQASRAVIQENMIVLDTPSGKLEFYLIEEN